MSDRNRIGLLLAALVTLLCAAPLRAQDDSPDNPLLRLLSYVPDAEVYREFISYGDLALWHERWGLERIQSVQDLEARSDREDPAVPATLFVLTRQTGAPNALGISYLLSENLRGYLGLDILNADRFIEAGNPPGTLTVVESAASGAVPGALAESGYSESALGEATLFSKGEDFEINLRDGDMPRTAQLAALNRVALLDDAVIIARATAVAEGAVAAGSGELPSLADNPVFAAGALAVSDPALVGDGALVGAIFMGQAEPLDIVRILGSRGTLEQADAVRQALDIGVTLPAYDLAVFATRSRADDTQLVLALVFPPGVDAQAATDALLMRMKRYTSLRTNELLMDLWAERGVEIEWGRGQEVGGLPVGLVSISARNPTLQDGEDGRAETYIFSWQDMVYALDLGFMAVLDE